MPGTQPRVQLLQRRQQATRRADIERTGQKLSFLRSVSSLSHLPAPTILRTAQLMRQIRYFARESVIIKGDYGDAFYVIESGVAEVLLPPAAETP